MVLLNLKNVDLQAIYGNLLFYHNFVKESSILVAHPSQAMLYRPIRGANYGHCRADVSWSVIVLW